MFWLYRGFPLARLYFPPTIVVLELLGAVYMLYLYRRVIFGVLEKDQLKALTDLNRREIAVFAPLVFVIIWMGVYPASFLDMISVSVDNLITNYKVALGEAGTALAAR